MRAASQADRAREYWLDSAREFRDIATDIQSYVSPAAAAAADLALWTGKLAYADAGWNLSIGPGQPVRSDAGLVPQIADVPAWWQQCLRRASARPAHGTGASRMSDQRLQATEHACTELATRGERVTFVTVAQRTGIPLSPSTATGPCAPWSRNTAAAHATPPS